MPPLLNALQLRLQHQFAEPALLQRAVTHRSFSADNNERLEFLGDSVLNLAISSLLYQRLSSMPEGDLSRVRANLVKEGTLHQIALRLQLPDLLRLGEGESKSGGKQRPSILADAVEALIGAVYLDAGYAAGEKVVHHLFEGVDINPHMRAAEKDAKTALQEWLQGAAHEAAAVRSGCHHGRRPSPDLRGGLRDCRVATAGPGNGCLAQGRRADGCHSHA